MNKIAIFYDTVTGNTKKCAYHILETLSTKATLYDSLGPCEEEIVCFGFWTDKGTCSEKAKQFLKTLHHKKIFLFGTAGFGTSKAYFDSIIKRVELELSNDNIVLGTFLCSGEMQPSVKENQEALLNEHPEDQKASLLLHAYEEGKGHPNQEDLNQLTKQLLRSLGQVV